MKNQISLFAMLMFVSFLYADNFITIKDGTIILDNGVIKRQIQLEEGKLFSSEFKLKDGSNFCVSDASKEFSFLIDDKYYDGFTGWDIIKTKLINDETGGQGITITLKEINKKQHIEVELHYMIYPELPVIRKWMTVRNIGENELKIEAVLIEVMKTTLPFYWTEVFHDFARTKSHGQYIGNAYDPLVVIHDNRKRMGMALGNEAIGVIKRTAYNTGLDKATENNIEIGMTFPNQDFPFRRWLSKNETWTSPKTFICLYENTDNAFDVVNNQVNEFMIKHMQPRIVKVKEKPTFLYNTWQPFMREVNDRLVKELINIAAECGIEEFCIDDGWQAAANGAINADSKGFGDWAVNQKKFKGGLKPTFDIANEKGIRPGLWIAVATASYDSDVFIKHPEYFVKNKEGEFVDLQHTDQKGERFTASFGTEWKNHIKDRILAVVRENNLSYVKLDFAVATSAYVRAIEHSGSYATNHPYYKDHTESFGVIYERLLQLFDELHKAEPNLFIDCTYETAGRPHLTDYAIANHAEGNWLSNFQEPSPTGPLRIRNLAWRRTPIIPASSLVIGNFSANDLELEFGLKSLIGTMPVLLGDLRKLNSNDKQLIQSWAAWINKMQHKYNYMIYRKDLPGFGEPKQGAWDGWQRINFQTKKGGIVGVFKQLAKENTRLVFITDLDPNAHYEVKLAPNGTLIETMSGKELNEKGFTVTINKEFDGMIYEIGIKN